MLLVTAPLSPRACSPGTQILPSSAPFVLSCRWDLQALDPLQFKSIIILTDNADSASGGDLDGVTCASMSAADSLSLTTMLLLRQTQVRAPRLRCLPGGCRRLGA